VAYTDLKQMFAVVASLLIAVAVLIAGLPHSVSVGDALRVAGSTGRLQIFDFRLNFQEQYTFWSGTIAALFLFLSYFGTDQSQVQRYLAAKSEDEARSSLMVSAFWKIPLQALVLIVGVLMFTFYLFSQPPMLFNPVHEAAVRSSARAGEYATLQQQFDNAIAQRRDAATAFAGVSGSDGEARTMAAATFKNADEEVKRVRAAAVGVVKDVSGDKSYNDVNYVFPTFVTTQIPMGLAGLIVAAILVAAMSASSAELSSLATASVIDFYKRFGPKDTDDRHVLIASRIATGFWGLFASIVAIWATELGSLIEVVNRFGSLFYGSILGVFILAVGFKRANSTGAFAGMIAGMTVIVAVASYTKIAFLWHNPIAAAVVVSVGLVVSEFTQGSGTRDQGSVDG
jgi:Na+/proline symporter